MVPALRYVARRFLPALVILALLQVGAFIVRLFGH